MLQGCSTVSVLLCRKLSFQRAVSVAQRGPPDPTISIVSVVIKVFGLWLAGGVAIPL